MRGSLHVHLYYACTLVYADYEGVHCLYDRSLTTMASIRHSLWLPLVSLNIIIKKKNSLLYCSFVVKVCPYSLFLPSTALFYFVFVINVIATKSYDKAISRMLSAIKDTAKIFLLQLVVQDNRDTYRHTNDVHFDFVTLEIPGKLIGIKVHALNHDEMTDHLCRILLAERSCIKKSTHFLVAMCMSPKGVNFMS